MDWPRTYHLYIIQKQEHSNFGMHILDTVRDGCIQIIGKPKREGLARSGYPKWRGCIVQVQHNPCLVGLKARLQAGSITFRDQRIKN
jgi:hypothetical protein